MSYTEIWFFLTGGHEVASSIPGFDFHINVCRGITAETNGHTKNCRQNSSMCRVNRNLQSADDIGNINSVTQLQLSSTNPDYIILIYNTTTKPHGCSDYPVTNITFRCTRELVSCWLRYDCNVKLNFCSVESMRALCFFQGYLEHVQTISDLEVCEN